MTRTGCSAGGGRAARRGNGGGRPDPAGHSPASIERAVVLAGFAPAILCTLVRLVFGAGGELAAGLWISAALWAALASAVLALRRGLRHRDWSAFARYRLPDGRGERIDFVSQTGQYAWMRIAEEHERLMRRD